MSSTKRRRTRSASSLDFNDAMSNFQAMFPREDVRVIEAVLRSNDGSVGNTIDHLLSIDSVTRRAILSNRDDSSCNSSENKLGNSDSQSWSDVTSMSECRHPLQHRFALSRVQFKTRSEIIRRPFNPPRCLSQSETYSERSGLQPNFNELHCKGDFDVRRALGSFSSVSSEPPRAITEHGKMTSQDFVTNRTSETSLRPCARSLSSVTSLDVVQYTPSDVSTWHGDETMLLGAPASPHVERNEHTGTRSRQGNSPVINVFHRLTSASLNSVSDNEVFVHTMD